MKQSVKTILIILFGASLLPPVFMLFQDLISPNESPQFREFLINIAYSIGPTISLTAGCTLSIAILNKRMSWKEKPGARLVTELVVILSLATGVAFLFTYANPMASDETARNSLFFTNIFFNLFITLFIVTVLEALFFFQQWKESRLESERLQKEHFKAQFQNLKNQVNPHLLFNSLNALTSLIEKDTPKAVQYVQDLSRYLRLVLNQSNEEAIELGDEISLLYHYYQLQRERFKEAFVIEMDIPENLHKELIPPLVLQMLVENAVKHNVISRSHPLVISVSWKEGCIEVSNKKRTKPSDEASTGVGLENIASRYELLGSQDMEVFDEEDAFRVRIPLLKVNEHAHTHN